MITQPAEKHTLSSKIESSIKINEFKSILLIFMNPPPYSPTIDCLKMQPYIKNVIPCRLSEIVTELY